MAPTKTTKHSQWGFSGGDGYERGNVYQVKCKPIHLIFRRTLVRDWRLLLDSVNTEYKYCQERAARGDELALVEAQLGNSKFVVTGISDIISCHYLY